MSFFPDGAGAYDYFFFRTFEEKYSHWPLFKLVDTVFSIRYLICALRQLMKTDLGRGAQPSQYRNARRLHITLRAGQKV